jgi:hypothetical protein
MYWDFTQLIPIIYKHDTREPSPFQHNIGDSEKYMRAEKYNHMPS